VMEERGNPLIFWALIRNFVLDVAVALKSAAVP